MTRTASCRASIALFLVWVGCGGGAGSNANAGSGGASAAGTTSTGGARSSGGTQSTGGVTNTGGTESSGGTPSSGGATGSGGSLGVTNGGSPEEEGSAGSTDTAGSAGTSGAASDGGAAGSGGTAGSAGAAGTAGTAGTAGCFDAGTGGSAEPPVVIEKFSFFVTSHDAMRALSGSEKGFGGDLRFGETGPGAGLRGADKICTTIAEKSMPGAGAKGWRAFLSATHDGRCDGGRVDAIDRVGNGPWYDRLGRLVAANREALSNLRPAGADAAISDDLPDESGAPNRCSTGTCLDNHDTLTGFMEPDATLRVLDTCQDWTSSAPEAGRPMVGHSWSSEAIPSWLQAHRNLGCAPGGTLLDELPSEPTVGSGGGYGGIYCFALVP